MKLFRLLIVLKFVLLFYPVLSQPNLIYITHQTISEVCFDRTRFVGFVDKQIKILESFQKKSEKPYHFMLFTTIHTDTAPDIRLASIPVLPAPEYQLLVEKLSKIKPIKSYLIDFHYAIELKDKRSPSINDLLYQPEIKNPVVEAENLFIAAPLDKKIDYLKEKAIREALPVLAAFARNSHHRYPNVISMGNRIDKSLETENINIDSMTTYNPRYWKAMIEMMPDNYLIYAIKTYLLIADGQLDKAYRLASVLELFKKNNSVADYYLDELMWLNIIFRQQELMLDSVQKYIDLQKFETAQHKLDELITLFPNSAEAWKKQYLLNRLTGNNSPEIASRILKNDPFLCPVNDSSELSVNKKYQLMKKTDSLFQKKENFHRDFMYYADIALQLGEYDFAAHLYWLAITHFSDQEAGRTNLNSYFLLCLQKLGLHDLITELDKNGFQKINQLENELKN